jgi:hypothetical protein
MSIGIGDTVATLEAAAAGHQVTTPRWVHDVEDEAYTYARVNNLVENFERHCVEWSPPGLSISTSDELLQDDPLPALCLQTFNITEKFTATEGAARIVAEQVGWRANSDIGDLVVGVLAVKTQSHKLETPLLRTDHRLDCAKVRERICSISASQIGNLELPLEPVDMESDEGLEFPASASKAAERLEASTAMRTIDVNKSTLIYLQNVFTTKEWTNDDKTAFYEELCGYKRVSNVLECLLHVTDIESKENIQRLRHSSNQPDA